METKLRDDTFYECGRYAYKKLCENLFVAELLLKGAISGLRQFLATESP